MYRLAHYIDTVTTEIYYGVQTKIESYYLKFWQVHIDRIW